MKRTDTSWALPYSQTELQEIANLPCSKTILDIPEVTLRPALFCQPIDIGISLTGDRVAEIANMDNYPLRSPDNAIAYIGSLLKTGMRSIMIRMDSPASYKTRDEVLERQAQIVQDIRGRFGAEALDIIVDPFSVALNADKTWGVIVDGKLNYLKTAELFSKITRCFSTAGATYVLTLGRFEREVDVTYRTIQKMGASARVSSFSTNTETTNAYVYADHGAYAVTKQKILVSNYNEMVFRALVDIYEGSSLVVVKPSENLHVLGKIQNLAQHPALLEEFLGSKQVNLMSHQSPYLSRIRSDMLDDSKHFATKLSSVLLGAYTVSGTYFMDMQTRKRKGDAFLASVLHERFSNIASVLNERDSKGYIIDRNALWFVQHHQA